MNYKKTYTPKKGYTPLCEIGKCSLNTLEFGIIELGPNEELDFDTKDREVAFILLGGKAKLYRQRQELRHRRRTPQRV